MAITRRELILNFAKAGVPAAVAMATVSTILQAEEISAPHTPVGLLYDATLCSGCKVKAVVAYIRSLQK